MTELVTSGSVCVGGDGSVMAVSTRKLRNLLKVIGKRGIGRTSHSVMF